jgi:RNA polymerase sigma factor (sigma-70 family)
VEVSALKHPAVLRGPTPFLRLQSDERLVDMTRRGNQAAYEALVARYQSRLQSFCRHMLGSKEDAEDVLQEVFAAAFNAMLADDRPINLRPWLYRIARNRSLNHLRRQRAVGVDSMDVHLAEGGITTAEKAQKREDLRLLVTDVQGLAETQRTALLLREIDALSYDQIAEAMETTVPAIKSLLVRARVSLAESAEARALTCDEVRDELGEVAEGLRRMSPPVRRHVKSCDRCSAFHDLLKTNNKALAAVFPVGTLMLLKKLLLAHVGAGNAAAAGGASGGAAATTAGGSVAAGSALSAGMGAIATKAAAGLAAVAIVSAGAVEVHNVRHHAVHHHALVAAAPKHAVVRAPVIVPLFRQPAVAPAAPLTLHHIRHHVQRTLTHTKPVVKQPVTTTEASVPVAPAPAPAPVPTTTVTQPVVATPPTPAPPQSASDSTDLPGGDTSTPTVTTPVATAPVDTTPVAPPVDTTPAPVPVDTTPAPPPTDTTPTDTTPTDTTPVTPPVDTTPPPPPPPAPPTVTVPVPPVGP